MLPVRRRDLTAQGAVDRGVSVAFAHGLDRHGLQCWWRKGRPLPQRRHRCDRRAHRLRQSRCRTRGRHVRRFVHRHRTTSWARPDRRRGPPPWPRTQRRGHTAIVERIVTPYTEPEVERSLLPSAPRMTLNSMLPPWKIDPARFVYGLLPEGNARAPRSRPASTNSSPTAGRSAPPGSWPCAPTTVAASSSAATMSPARSARRPRPRLRSLPFTHRFASAIVHTSTAHSTHQPMPTWSPRSGSTS